MKYLALLIFLLSGISLSAGTLFTIDFSTDTTGEWSTVANAADPEASISWNSTGGVSGGALELSGVNPNAGVGKAYIWEANVDLGSAYTTVQDITLTFDVKLTQPLVGTALHFLSNNPGSGDTPKFNFQNEGVNETDWTTITHTISGMTAGHNNLQMQFQIAAGAVSGHGGGMLLDNIVASVVPEPSTYAFCFGLLTLGFVALRRRTAK